MIRKIFIVLLLTSSFANAQVELTPDKVTQITNQVDRLAIKYRDSVSKNFGEKVMSLDTEFKTDLYRVEKIADLKVAVDYSTAGMTAAIVDLNRDYDQLLNKYYGILRKKLKGEDQEKLKLSQRNWIKFRDSEILVISTVSKDQYSGGGTIQSNIMAGRISDLTKERLFTIKNHLNQFIE